MQKPSREKSTIISIIMCACFACAVIVYALSDQDAYSAKQVFHISSELSCMAVTLVMYLWHLRRKNMRDRSERIFEALCLLIYSALFIDLFTWIYDGRVNLIWLNKALNILVYIITYIHGVLYIEYVFSHIDQDSDVVKNLKKGVYVLFRIGALIRILFSVFGLYFVFDSNGYYQNGPLFALAYALVPIISVFVCGAATGYGLSLTKLLAFLSYPVSILFMLGIAFINGNYANPLIVITLSTIFIYCATFLDTEDQKGTLSENFQRYLSEDIVSQLTQSGMLQPGGSTINVSMIFCALHGFGDVMETMQPEDAVKILNHFYGEIADIIVKNNGTLLEFPGYGVFCIFGAFNDCDKHADAAIKTAVEMQKRMPAINFWNEKNNYPDIHIGIGINTGDVVLGNIGSKNHLRYSAISRHVNLASRVETYAEDEDIIITQNTLDASDTVSSTEKILTIIPKGISQPIDIYKITGIIED